MYIQINTSNIYHDQFCMQFHDYAENQWMGKEDNFLSKPLQFGVNALISQTKMSC